MVDGADMGTITNYGPQSKTQRAKWTSADGLAWAAVTFQNVKDERGAWGFAYELSGPTDRENIGFHHTFAADSELIYAPMCNPSDTVDVLETLASFVGAWAESVEYGERNGRETENGDLFPMSCRGFVDYADEFSSDTYIDGDES